MAKNQAKTDSEDQDPWVADDAGDFDEAANDVVPPAKAKLAVRHKIEDLIEQRRLKAQLGDYEVLDLDERKPRRLH